VDSAVTIILPVHNSERTLRPLLLRILDVAAAPSRRLTLAVVDDGSTDETFEAACELARDYPQIRVFRQPRRQGLAAALEQVRKRLNVEEAIVHDGAGPIDFDELAALLAARPAAAAGVQDESHHGRGSRRFAAVSALNARLAEAHRSISSLHWLRLSEPAKPRRRFSPIPSLAGNSTGETSLGSLGSNSFATDFPIAVP
jgi:hypothetical protein